MAVGSGVELGDGAAVADWVGEGVALARGDGVVEGFGLIFTVVFEEGAGVDVSEGDVLLTGNGLDGDVFGTERSLIKSLTKAEPTIPV